MDTNTLHLLEKKIEKLTQVCPEFSKNKLLLTHFMFKTMKKVEQEIAASMVRAGLPEQSWFILMVSYSAGEAGLISSDLCSMLTQNKSTVSRVVDGLINQGLLERKYDTEDRRKISLYMTEDGKKFVENRLPLHARYFDAIWAGVDEPGLARELERVAINARQTSLEEIETQQKNK